MRPPRSRILSVRALDSKIESWQKAAALTPARSFNAWVVKALDEAAALERALNRQKKKDEGS